MSDTSFFANLDDPKATPLHWAALRGNLGEVQALLAAEPGSVAVTDNHMWAPLHWAVAAGQAECAAALVRGGANLEVGGREAHTPWMANLDKFFYFDSPARHAEADKLAAAGFVRGAQALREGIAQTDPKALVGATPLHVAAGMGAVDCIRCLLKLGAPLEAANSLGLTAIHLAAACNHVQALQALLQAGADVRACDGYSNTPLHLAAGGGATACIKELLTASADMEASTEGGATPLHFAAAGGMLEALRVLIDAGAHVHATDEDGETPLHRAAAAGCVEAGTALLTAGTNLAAATTEPLGCRSPTLIAAGHGIIATVSALVAAGADINLRSGNGDTCLHVFLKRACMGYVPKAPKQLQQLLDLGASVELACEAWPTPVDAMLREIGNAKGCKLPSCVPKLVRVMVAAGCSISKPHRHAHLGMLMHSTIVSWFHRLGFDIDWPPSLSDSAVDLGCALLDCLEAAGLCGTGEETGCLMRSALETGSPQLAARVAGFLLNNELDADAARHSLSHLMRFYERALKGLPCPGRGGWGERHQQLVHHFCDMAEALLAAGCPPLELRVSSRGRSALSSAEETSNPGTTVTVDLPSWAEPHLREVVPLAASGLRWSPGTHRAFPPRFHAAWSGSSQNTAAVKPSRADSTSRVGLPAV